MAKRTLVHAISLKLPSKGVHFCWQHEAHRLLPSLVNFLVLIMLHGYRRAACFVGGVGGIDFLLVYIAVVYAVIIG